MARSRTQWWLTEPPAPPDGQGKRQARAITSRARILLAAAELFSEQGYVGTSLMDVARHAGMTRGAVYFHFDDKDAIARAVVIEHYAQWPPLLEGLRDQGYSGLGLLVAVLDGAAFKFAGDPVVQAGARLQLERSFIDADLPRPYVGWINLLESLIEDARRNGEVRESVDPAGTARSLVALFFGVQHLSDRLDRREGLVERWRESCDLVLHTLRN